jgi:hypothetical protein
MDPAGGLASSPTAVTLLFVLTCGLIAFARAPKGAPRWGLGLAHALVHLAAVGAVSMLASTLVVSVGATGLAASSTFLLTTLVAGALVGSFVMALYLWACNLAGMHSTETFSSMRIPDYKNFLRMHLGRDGTLTIYPVGIDRVARRTPLVSEGDPEAPWFDVQGQSTPHLVEEPVRICVARPARTVGSGTCNLTIPDTVPEQEEDSQPAEGALR